MDFSDAITLLYTHGFLSVRERDAARRRLATVKQTLTVPTFEQSSIVQPTCNDNLQVGESVRFLLEAARYFERRPTNGEDAAHWSNVTNAQNCRRAADILRTLSGAGAANFFSDEALRWRIARSISLPEHHTAWDMLTDRQKDLYYQQAGYALSALAAAAREGGDVKQAPAESPQSGPTAIAQTQSGDSNG